MQLKCGGSYEAETTGEDILTEKSIETPRQGQQVNEVG